MASFKAWVGRIGLSPLVATALTFRTVPHMASLAFDKTYKASKQHFWDDQGPLKKTLHGVVTVLFPILWLLTFVGATLSYSAYFYFNFLLGRGDGVLVYAKKHYGWQHVAHWRVVQPLLDISLLSASKLESRLWQAVASGDAQTTDWILAQDHLPPSIFSKQDDQGNTLLHKALCAMDLKPDKAGNYRKIALAMLDHRCFSKTLWQVLNDEAMPPWQQRCKGSMDQKILAHANGPSADDFTSTMGTATLHSWDTLSPNGLRSMFWRAIQRGKLLQVQKVFQYSPSDHDLFTMRDDKGNTPLHIAIDGMQAWDQQNPGKADNPFLQIVLVMMNRKAFTYRAWRALNNAGYPPYAGVPMQDMKETIRKHEEGNGQGPRDAHFNYPPGPHAIFVDAISLRQMPERAAMVLEDHCPDAAADILFGAAKPSSDCVSELLDALVGDDGFSHLQRAHMLRVFLEHKRCPKSLGASKQLVSLIYRSICQHYRWPFIKLLLDRLACSSQQKWQLLCDVLQLATPDLWQNVEGKKQKRVGRKLWLVRIAYFARMLWHPAFESVIDFHDQRSKTLLCKALEEKNVLAFLCLLVHPKGNQLFSGWDALKTSVRWFEPSILFTNCANRKYPERVLSQLNMASNPLGSEAVLEKVVEERASPPLDDQRLSPKDLCIQVDPGVSMGDGITPMHQQGSGDTLS